MGQFAAGPWFIGLLIYFFAFFVIVNYVIAGASDLGIDSGYEFNDPGFTSTANTTITTEAAAADTGSFAFFWDTISFMTGIGADDVSIGIPGAYQYMFSVLFFWLPLLMMLWAGWMALPFLH